MYKVTAVIALTIVLSSCGSTTYESFRPVQDRNVEIAYVNVVADFSQYRRLLIDDMGIYYPSNSNLSDADIQRVRGAFQDAFSKQLGGYEITAKPATDVLKVRASLVDLTGPPVAQLPDIGRDINKILKPGHLTFMIELSDSKSGRVLARAADTSRTPELDQPDDGSGNSAEVLSAATHWAQLFHDFLDANLT